MNTSTVRIERTWVNIDDDCFSPKPNSSDLYVNTMYCNGTHGQSMGSLGQYEGEVSNVFDVHIENVWMMNGDVSSPRNPYSSFSNTDNHSTPARASKSGPAKKSAPAMSTT